MKKIDIIYGHSLKGIEGINYVNNSFVEGGEYFKKNGLILSKIYSPYETFDCVNKKKMDLIGSNIHLNSYKRNRKFRLFLKQIFSSKSLIGSSIKFFFNYIRPSIRVVKKYQRINTDCDFIIFQSLFTAYFYFRYIKNKNRKSILILHCSYDPFEQISLDLRGIFSKKWFRNWIYKKLDFVFKEIDKVVYLSKRTTDCSSVSINKKTFIFNGEEDLDEHNFSDIHNPINLVSVGSMAWRKGQDYVIEALGELPEDIRNCFKLHLIGDGPQMQELKNLVNRYNLCENVIFYGSRNDVPVLLKDMDIFILPSISEGLPMSIIEALRQGMYVIATDTGAIPEMITPGCGELVERDAQKIAKCLSDIIIENRITLEMKQKAREHYLKNFTLRKMIYNYCDLLKSL